MVLRRLYTLLLKNYFSKEKMNGSFTSRAKQLNSVTYFNTAPNASNYKTLLTDLLTQNTQGVEIKQELHIPVRRRHSAHAFNHSDIKRE